MDRPWILALCLTLWSVACMQSQKKQTPTSVVTADQTLSKLTVIADRLEPQFDPFVNDYSLAGGVSRRTSIIVNTAPVNPRLQVLINGVKLRPDFTTDPLPLLAGANTFNIALADSEGTVVNTYRLQVLRVETLEDESLDDLATSDGQLVPSFTPELNAYQLTVGKDTSVLTVSPLASYPSEAIFIINGQNYSADLGGYDVAVPVGNSKITFTVKGKSGRTKSYSIDITRPAP